MKTKMKQIYLQALRIIPFIFAALVFSYHHFNAY